MFLSFAQKWKRCNKSAACVAWPNAQNEDVVCVLIQISRKAKLKLYNVWLFFLRKTRRLNWRWMQFLVILWLFFRVSTRKQNETSYPIDIVIIRCKAMALTKPLCFPTILKKCFHFKYKLAIVLQHE